MRQRGASGTASIEIEDVVEIPGRGAGIAATIAHGALNVGMETEPLAIGEVARRLHVSTVDFLEHVVNHRSLAVLFFKEMPTRDELARAMPVRTMVSLRKARSG